MMIHQWIRIGFPPKKTPDFMGSSWLILAPRQVCEDDGSPKKTIVFANTKATLVTAASLERRWMVGKHPRWPYDVSAIFADSWTRDKSLRIRPEVAYDPLKSVWLTQEVSIWTSSWQISEPFPGGGRFPGGERFPGGVGSWPPFSFVFVHNGMTDTGWCLELLRRAYSLVFGFVEKLKLPTMVIWKHQIQLVEGRLSMRRALVLPASWYPYHRVSTSHILAIPCVLNVLQPYCKLCILYKIINILIYSYTRM